MLTLYVYKATTIPPAAGSPLPRWDFSPVKGRLLCVVDSQHVPQVGSMLYIRARDETVVVRGVIHAIEPTPSFGGDDSPRGYMNAHINVFAGDVT